MSTLELVYDVRDGSWPPPSGRGWIQAWLRWLRLHGVEPNHTYRAEFHTIDAPLIRVFQYDMDTDANGKPTFNLIPGTRDIAHRTPFDVLITTPAPRPEDYL